MSWRFTWILCGIYLATFHAWMHLNRSAVITTGMVVAAALAVSLWHYQRNQYFVNLWDLVFHTSVILDIVLEAWLIQAHDHYGFYLCALGFGLVLVGYRSYVGRLHPTRRSRWASRLFNHPTSCSSTASKKI